MRPVAKATSAFGSVERRALLSSIGLHALLAALVAFGAVFTWHSRPEAVHSVEAYVVRGSALRHASPAPVAPAATPAAVAAAAPVAETPVPVAPPPPDAKSRPAPAPKSAPALPVSDEHAALAAKARAQEAEQASAQAKQAAQQKLADDRAKAAAEATEKAREKQAEAERAAHDKAEAAARQRREAELAQKLAAEEHADAQSAAQAGLLARYKADLTARVQRAWNRPPTARSGLKCTVHVTQVPGGTVTGVRLGDCNADPVVRRTIEEAVLRASPLPAPPDPSLFDRNLTLEFSPDD